MQGIEPRRLHGLQGPQPIDQKLLYIKLPMYLFFYMALGLNDFEAGNIHYEGHLKGWALNSRLFCGLKWQRAKRVPFGPKKVENSGLVWSIG